MRLWERSTDIEPSQQGQQGANLLWGLNGVALAVVDDIDVDHI